MSSHEEWADKALEGITPSTDTIMIQAIARLADEVAALRQDQVTMMDYLKTEIRDMTTNICGELARGK